MQKKYKNKFNKNKFNKKYKNKNIANINYNREKKYYNNSKNKNSIDCA